MIILYTGRRGAGKTTAMVWQAAGFKAKGWKIYTNMNSLSFADAILSNEELVALVASDDNDFVLVLDEIQTFIDSRRSMRGQNVDFTYFIQQIRKKNCVILATTQFSRRVDLAFREHVDIVARPELLEEYPVMVVDYTDLTILDDDPDSDNARTTIVFNPRHAFGLFDTTETIDPKR